MEPAVTLKAAGIDTRSNFKMAPLTTFKIGGKADLYIKVNDARQLATAINVLTKAKKRYMVAGNLSNVLISDKRLKMAFVVLGPGFAKVSRKGLTVTAGAALRNSQLLAYLARNGLSGLEFLTGVPGTVGGAVYMNAGAYGCGIGGLITKVSVADRRGRMKEIKNNGRLFSYRKSRFQKDGSVITGVTLRLKPGKSREIAAEMGRIIKERHSKHPWDAACAGSFFKNSKKYTAGKLIEAAGLKGLKTGGAKVSEKHANFLINDGNAKFDDVIRLAAKVKRAVYKKFKVKLEEEVRIIK